MCCKNQVFFWYKKRTYKAYLPFLLLRDIHGFLGGNVPHGIFVNVHAKKTPHRGAFLFVWFKVLDIPKPLGYVDSKVTISDHRTSESIVVPHTTRSERSEVSVVE